MSIHVSGGGPTPRRVVIACDAPGCSSRAEPPAAESWRSTADATTWARDQAQGWVFGPAGDFCPEHARSEARSPISPAGRVGYAADPGAYAARLRQELAAAGPADRRVTLTATQVSVAARLLDELAGAHRGHELGSIAAELAAVLRAAA